MVKIYTLRVESLDHPYDEQFKVSLIDNNDALIESWFSDYTVLFQTMDEFKTDYPDAIITLETVKRIMK